MTEKYLGRVVARLLKRTARRMCIQVKWISINDWNARVLKRNVDHYFSLYCFCKHHIACGSTNRLCFTQTLISCIPSLCKIFYILNGLICAKSELIRQSAGHKIQRLRVWDLVVKIFLQRLPLPRYNCCSFVSYLHEYVHSVLVKLLLFPKIVKFSVRRRTN